MVRLRNWEIAKRTSKTRLYNLKPVDWHMVAIAEAARPDMSRKDITYLFSYNCIPEKPLRTLLRMHKNTLLNATMLHEKGHGVPLCKAFPHEFDGELNNMHIMFDSKARQWIKQRLFYLMRQRKMKIPPLFSDPSY